MGCPPSTDAVARKNGRMTTETFIIYFAHFVKYMRCSDDSESATYCHRTFQHTITEKLKPARHAMRSVKIRRPRTGFNATSATSGGMRDVAVMKLTDSSRSHVICVEASARLCTYLRTDSLCGLSAAWLDASQRSRDSVRLKRSIME